MDFHSFLKDYQPIIYKTFKNAISSNKIAQAYLIKGSDGAPVLECAKYLAKSLICHENDGFACDTCLDCIRFDEGNYADFILIDGSKGSIKVPDIEALQVFLQSSTMEKKGKKIYIIHLLENANKESINALLKTLEEPSENIYAFITTQNETKLLPTILSRCQILNIIPFDKSIIKEEAIKEGLDSLDASLLSELYGNVQSIKEISQNETYLKCKDSLFLLLESLNYSFDKPIFTLNKDVLPQIKTKEEARLLIDLLSLMFKDILRYQTSSPLLIKDKEDLISSLASKLKHVEKDYLEIMLTRSKIEINVSLALLLQHIFIYIKEVEQNGNN